MERDFCDQWLSYSFRGSKSVALVLFDTSDHLQSGWHNYHKPTLSICRLLVHGSIVYASLTSSILWPISAPFLRWATLADSDNHFDGLFHKLSSIIKNQRTVPALRPHLTCQLKRVSHSIPLSFLRNKGSASACGEDTDFSIRQFYDQIILQRRSYRP